MMRPLLVRAALAAVVVTCLLAAPAFAEEAAGEHQPDLVQDNLSLRHFATAVGVFLLVLVVLTKTAWRPILDGLRRREDVIRQAVDDAQRASEEARALIARYEGKLSQARDEAREITEEGRRDGDALRRRILEDAERQSRERLEHALKEIDQARAKASEELLREGTFLATELASRIVRRELTPEANADLVDEVVREMEASRPAART